MGTPPERRYYEDPGIWTAERFADPFEQARLAACAGLVPQGAESLLDVGAGNGAFLGLLERLRPELGLAGIERAGAAARGALCRTPLVPGEADCLPFAAGTFDVVAALDVIEHLPCGVYERALGELARVARRHVLIDVPYRERRLKAVCPSCGCAFDPHYHMRSFDEAILARLVPGFRVARSAKVHRRENLLAAAARPFRRRVFSGFPETAVCPQCGFRAADALGGAGAGGGRASVRSAIKAAAQRLPSVRLAAEIVVLYQRESA